MLKFVMARPTNMVLDARREAQISIGEYVSNGFYRH